jgi:DNA-binding transcriptional LysR family regulator
MLDSLEGLDALVALRSAGTVSEAAVRLRLTQSAVSKRLRALQDAVGFPLIEPDGRRVQLTAAALDFVERAQPLIAELRALTRPTLAASPSSFRIALADSIASSWGPGVVRDALRALPATRAELHAHRSVLVIESVRLGRYDIGLCTEATGVKDLIQHPIVDEPLVLVHANLARTPARDLPLVTIEPTSATWRAIEPALRAHHPAWLAGPTVFVESFGAVVQMARAGFGNGLVPLGLARGLGLTRRGFAATGVHRRIALFTRKTVHQQAGYVTLREQLTRAAARVVPSGAYAPARRRGA